MHPLYSKVLNNWQRSRWLNFSIRLMLRIFILGCLSLATLLLLPVGYLTLIILVFVVLVFGFILFWSLRFKFPKEADFLLAMDILHGNNNKSSIWDPAVKTWDAIADDFSYKQGRALKRVLYLDILLLGAVLLLAVGAYSKAGFQQWGGFLGWQSVVMKLYVEDKEYVLEDNAVYKVPQGSVVNLRVLNLNWHEALTLEILPLDGSEKQHILLQKTEGDHYVSFVLDKSSWLKIPELSSDNIVELTLEAEILPQVKLTTTASSPWQENRPLPLRVFVDSPYPLTKVDILIESEVFSEARELVQRLRLERKYKLDVDYSLKLRRYLPDRDSWVNLRAEALAYAPDGRLVKGVSQVLRLETISLYAAYRRTLEKFAEFRHKIMAGEQPSFPDLELADSQFFDFEDRRRLSDLKKKYRQSMSGASWLDKAKFVNELTAWLAEHQLLDDWERDRDFFIIARELERVLERKDAAAVAAASTGLQSFLSERRQRWQERLRSLGVEDLASRMPSLDGRLDADSLGELVSEYQEWLDKLESLESKRRQAVAKEQLDLERQLQEIRWQQDEVGEHLQGELNSWELGRELQEKVLQAGEKFMAKARQFWPQALDRFSEIEAVMHRVQEAGQRRDFDLALSESVRASRMLRNLSEARPPRIPQVRRRRDRNGYYGPKVYTSDVNLQHEYSVNPRYREEVLKEAEQVEPAEKSLIKNYLRAIIR